MQAAAKTQLDLIEIFKKQNVALNRINLLLPKMYTPNILKTSGLEPSMNQLGMTLKSSKYNEKNIQHIKNKLGIPKKNLMNVVFNKHRAQLETDLKLIFNALYRTKVDLQAQINVVNDGGLSNDELINELEDDPIISEVQETIDVLSNNGMITREEYFKGLNFIWNSFLSVLLKIKPHLIPTFLIFINVVYNDVISPVNQALTQKYIIDEFIDKKPETVSKAKNVLKDIPMNKELKTNYRMVIKDTLVVRTSPKTKSNVAYVLDKSAIVFIEEKKKNWSKVLFRNEAGENQSGWVYTRYIKKLD